jgi:uncharacterized protein (DUF885 family)
MFTPTFARAALAAAGLSLVAGHLAAQPGITARAAGAALLSPPARSPALKALLDEHYRWLLDQDPLEASRLGDRRANARLRDESPAAYARRDRELADRLARLNAIDVDRAAPLSEADRLDADLLRYELELAVKGAPYHPEQTPIDTRSGPQIWLAQMGTRIPLTCAADFDDYAARLEGVPAYIDQEIEQMRSGLAAGRVPPKVVLEGTVEQCRALADRSIADRPESSAFFQPFRDAPASGPGAPSTGARERAARAIGSGIAPAFGRLADFLETEYIPGARASIGASEGVDGPAWYNLQLERHTTLPLTAQEIHEIGKAEVARIKAEMLRVIAQTELAKGTDPAVNDDDQFRVFVDGLRTNPRFYYSDPDALLSGYRDIAKRIDGELPRLFGKLPRASYGVREMPLAAAKTSPTAYYYQGSLKAGLSGSFMANTYRLDQRPRYEMRALTCHEAVPGHHLQIMLAEEMADDDPSVHPWRTTLGYTAFVEGWALYAERLGMEIGGPPPQADDAQTGRGSGLYSDPYDNFGRLSYEMWRACRLVVDTGVHALGWTRRQAIDFMAANTALTELNIEREVDRYIAWPGQATAYKIGELTIRRIRADAERELGPKFDLRAFHDHLLGAGALPLPVLEARMKRWVETRKAGS